MTRIEFYVTRRDGKSEHVVWHALDEPLSVALKRAGVPRLAWHQTELDVVKVLAKAKPDGLVRE